MSAVLSVFRREFASYFATPLAVVFLVIFLALAGAFTFYLGGFYEAGQADLQAFFRFHPWLYLLLAPAVAMRLWAEERKSGTIELLLTLPGAWFCAGCAMAALRIPAGQGLLVLAVLAAFVWLTAQLGLALGLCLPNLHWVSEAAVVKRSAASMLAMFGGWLLAGGVLFLPLILLDYAVPPLAAQTVCLAVLLGLDLLLHRWLCTRGAARFAALH